MYNIKNLSRRNIMSEAVIVAIIGGAFTLVGVLISNSKKDGVIEERLNELTREVKEHNNFAKRVPIVENDIQNIKEDIKELKQGN